MYEMREKYCNTVNYILYMYRKKGNLIDISINSFFSFLFYCRIAQCMKQKIKFFMW